MTKLILRHLTKTDFDRALNSFPHTPHAAAILEDLLVCGLSKTDISKKHIGNRKSLSRQYIEEWQAKFQEKASLDLMQDVSKADLVDLSLPAPLLLALFELGKTLEDHYARRAVKKDAYEKCVALMQSFADSYR